MQDLMVFKKMQVRLRFLAGMTSDRINKLNAEEIEGAGRTLSDAMLLLEETLNIKNITKPTIIFENRGLKHYAEIINGSVENGGRFDLETPDNIFLVRGYTYTRAIPHELMHYTIYKMNWNPQFKTINQIIKQNIWFNKIAQWRMAIVSIMEECSCYIFDAMYNEKVTGKKFVNMANWNFANEDKFATKFYQSLGMKLAEVTISGIAFNLKRKYRNEDMADITTYMRLLSSVNILVLKHNKYDLKASLMDVIDMQQRGFEYSLAKLSTYIPPDLPNSKLSDLVSLD